jgi:hypothetical protein
LLVADFVRHRCGKGPFRPSSSCSGIADEDDDEDEDEIGDGENEVR